MAIAQHTTDARVLVGIDISKNRHEVPRAGGPSETLSPADQARLAALEEELRALRSREDGVNREELQAMLDANAAQMRAEMNRMLISQQPVMSASINPDMDAESYG